MTVAFCINPMTLPELTLRTLKDGWSEDVFQLSLAGLAGVFVFVDIFVISHLVT